MSVDRGDNPTPSRRGWLRSALRFGGLLLVGGMGVLLADRPDTHARRLALCDRCPWAGSGCLDQEGCRQMRQPTAREADEA